MSGPENVAMVTSRRIVEREAERHGVIPEVVDGWLSCITFRPSGEAILWRAVVPESERVALGLAVA